jgi:serine/threonine-protein kinase HipA
MKSLDVYLGQDCVGHLIQNEQGQLAFTYSNVWLHRADAIPLSTSLPLREESFSRNECRGFFEGILPESGQREQIARNLGISARNDFALLEQIGGECAGAVTFISSGTPFIKEMKDQYRALSPMELAKILDDLPQRPLMAGTDGVRLSLAGAQDKIAVRVNGNDISVPLGNAPSTHILKPAVRQFKGLVFNEAFCMRLASRVGLVVANVEIRKVEDIDYLLVERYDRHQHDEIMERIHQEDFCQALNIISELKYQNEGGPSLKQCFDLLRSVSSAPVIDLQGLLDAVIFNFAIGNHDAHGKNFSLLRKKNDIRLAPLYDLVCTSYYPNLSTKMAMKIGGEYKSADIFPRHFERLAEEANLGKALVVKRVVSMAQTILREINAIAVEDDVAEDVSGFIKNNVMKIQERFSGKEG